MGLQTLPFCVLLFEIRQCGEREMCIRDRGTAGADNGFFSTVWKNLYEGIHRANDAIVNLSVEGGGGVDEDVRLRLLSEFKSLRAY